LTPLACFINYVKALSLNLRRKLADIGRPVAKRSASPCCTRCTGTSAQLDISGGFCLFLYTTFGKRWHRVQGGFIPITVFTWITLTGAIYMRYILYNLLGPQISDPSKLLTDFQITVL
jgi:hypothetical protein